MFRHYALLAFALAQPVWAASDKDLDEIRNLSHSGEYAKIAKTYEDFVAAHPTMKYHATEPVPFLIGNHIVEKTGKSSAFSTMTIRNPTWTDKLVRALTDSDKFAGLVEKLEADVNAIAKKI